MAMLCGLIRNEAILNFDYFRFKCNKLLFVDCKLATYRPTAVLIATNLTCYNDSQLIIVEKDSLVT